MQFTILEEKFVGHTVYSGRLVAISAREANIEAETALPRLSNLRLEVEAVDGANPRGEIYAKVVGQTADSGGETLIRYTSITPELKVWLRKFDAQAATEADKSRPSKA
jgi:hypothetical protein